MVIKKDGTLPKRAEVAEQFRWDLESIYSTVADWEMDYKKVVSELPELSSFQGKLSDSGKMLLSCLRTYEKIGEILGKVFVYATMRSHEDTDNGDSKALADRAMMLNVQVSTASSFLVPEILSMDEAFMWNLLEEEPDLELYRFFLEQIIETKDHVLSAREEEIIAGMGEVAHAPEQIFSMLTNADIKFPSIKDEKGVEQELSEERYYRFIRSGDRRVRKEAFEGIHKTYGKYRNTLGATYGASVKEDVFSARIHRYDSSIEAALDGGKIPLSVYDNTVSVVNENLSLLHDYMAIRKRALGVEELHMYDLYVPVVKDPDVNIDWEEAKETVFTGLHPLGKDYTDLLRKGAEDRWIDVYENKGKRSGAYSWGSYGTHPFVLLNYNGTLRDVFTLAHEMGHSLHSWHTHDTQPYIYGDYTIFVAEVASTTNEALLMNHLLKKSTDKKEKMFLLNYYLEQIRTTVYRQTMFAEFERETHSMAEKGIPLTPDALNSMWSDLNQRYYGPEMVVDDDIAVEWARIPHFYSSFYVYQYATGYAAATTLADRIINEGDSAREDYINFLRGGSSKYSIDLLKGAGVDMSTRVPLERTMKVFSDKLKELKSLMES